MVSWRLSCDLVLMFRFARRMLYTSSNPLKIAVAVSVSRWYTVTSYLEGSQSSDFKTGVIRGRVLMNRHT